MFYVGIDSGVSGGAVVVHSTGYSGKVARMVGEGVVRDDRVGSGYSVGGVVVPRIDVADVRQHCEITCCVSTAASSPQNVSYNVRRWRTLYAPSFICLEHVGIVQRQRGNDVLMRSMGWWEGVLTALDLQYVTVRPSRWKRWSGIPCAKSKREGGSKAKTKALACDRANELFPWEVFVGKRGGTTTRDWYAECAMLALCARQLHMGLGVNLEDLP